MIEANDAMVAQEPPPNAAKTRTRTSSSRVQESSALAYYTRQNGARYQADRSVAAQVTDSRDAGKSDPFRQRRTSTRGVPATRHERPQWRRVVRAIVVGAGPRGASSRTGSPPTRRARLLIEAGADARTLLVADASARSLTTPRFRGSSRSSRRRRGEPGDSWPRARRSALESLKRIIYIRGQPATRDWAVQPRAIGSHATCCRSSSARKRRGGASEHHGASGESAVSACATTTLCEHGSPGREAGNPSRRRHGARSDASADTADLRALACERDGFLAPVRARRPHGRHGAPRRASRRARRRRASSGAMTAAQCRRRPTASDRRCRRMQSPQLLQLSARCSNLLRRHGIAVVADRPRWADLKTLQRASRRLKGRSLNDECATPGARPMVRWLSGSAAPHRRAAGRRAVATSTRPAVGRSASSHAALVDKRATRARGGLLASAARAARSRENGRAASADRSPPRIVSRYLSNRSKRGARRGLGSCATSSRSRRSAASCGEYCRAGVVARRLRRSRASAAAPCSTRPAPAGWAATRARSSTSGCASAASTACA